MRDVTYFELGKSLDPKEMGPADLYQITDIRGGYNRETLDRYHLFSRQDLADRLPNLDHFVLAGNAKVTDVLSNVFLQLSKGLFVNDTVKLILENVSIANYKIHKSKIHRDHETLHYYFYHIVESPEVIEYEESEFQITDILGLKKMGAVQFKSAQEYYAKCKEIGANCIAHESVTLKNGYDLFRLPWEMNLCISERLRDLLIENKVSGIAIEPSKTQFFLD